MEPVTLSSSQYKLIRKMSKEDLEDFLTRSYIGAYNAGVDNMSKVMVGKVEEALKSTKGIGQVKFNAIMESLVRVFNEE